MILVLLPLIRQIGRTAFFAWLFSESSGPPGESMGILVSALEDILTVQRHVWDIYYIRRLFNHEVI